MHAEFLGRVLVNAWVRNQETLQLIVILRDRTKQPHCAPKVRLHSAGKQTWVVGFNGEQLIGKIHLVIQNGDKFSVMCFV